MPAELSRRGRTLERRCVALRPILEARAAVAEGEVVGQTIRGHAAVFNTWTTLYESRSYKWLERIKPGAFLHAIAESQDVYALFNHNPDWILGRSTAKTCRLAEDKVGLAFEADPDESNVIISSLVLRPMGRGELDRCSFAFTVRDGGETITIREENGVMIEERELTDLDLYDVSVVTYPAYQDAECELVDRARARETEIRSRLAGERRADPHYQRRRMALRLFP